MQFMLKIVQGSKSDSPNTPQLRTPQILLDAFHSLFYFHFFIYFYFCVGKSGAAACTSDDPCMYLWHKEDALLPANQYFQKTYIRKFLKAARITWHALHAWTCTKQNQNYDNFMKKLALNIQTNLT